MAKYSKTEKKIFKALENIQFEKDKDAELARYRQGDKDSFSYKIIFVVTLVLMAGGAGYYKYTQFKQDQIPISVNVVKKEYLAKPIEKPPIKYIPEQKTYTPRPEHYSSKQNYKVTHKVTPKVEPFFYKIYLHNGGTVSAQSIRIVNDKIYINENNMKIILQKSDVLEIEKINQKTLVSEIVEFH